MATKKTSKRAKKVRAAAGTKRKTPKNNEDNADDEVQMNLKVSRSIKRRLKRYSADSETPMAEIVERALLAYLPDEPDA